MTRWQLVPVLTILASLQVFLAQAREIEEPALATNTSEAERCFQSQQLLEQKGEELKHVEAVASHVIAPAWSVVGFAILASGLLERFHVHWFPESAVTIVLGLLAGIAMRSFVGRDAMLQVKSELNMVSLNLFFLPIIIFESGWSVRMKDFGSQFQYILVFAILGTSICVFIVAMLIHLTSEYHAITDLRTAFAYASLICSTDPVATLATYSSLKVEPLLNIMVFGESMINDAVAVVLFEIMNSPDNLSSCGGSMPDVSGVIQGVAQTFLLSTAIGMIGAMASALCMRITKINSPASQSLYMVAVAYIVYAKAEAWGASGIIATLFASITMNLYLKPHMSHSDELLASFFIKQLASIGDMGIFILVGVDATLSTSLSLQLSAWVMLFCLVARAVVVFPLGLTVNCCKRFAARNSRSRRGDHLDNVPVLSGGHLFMMWHAGLRGGIALVLCLQLGEWVDMENGPGTRKALAGATVSIITVFLLVFGGSTSFCLRQLGIPTGQEYDEDYLSKHSVMNCTRSSFNWIDEKLVWPCLVGPGTRQAWHEARAKEEQRLNQNGDPSCNEVLMELNRLHRSASTKMHLHHDHYLRSVREEQDNSSSSDEA